ncbi:hypothetical protein GSH10_17250 [Burkholderia pseudomallei]|nr:hypothetical protein [Burkholderia pseudomallei]
MRAAWGYQTSRRDHNPAFTRSARAAQRARRLRPPRYGDISTSRMHARNRDVTQCRHAGSRAARAFRAAVPFASIESESHRNLNVLCNASSTC